MKKYILILILSVSFRFVSAQTSFVDSCNIKFRMAQKSFEKGNFEEVVSLLQNCISSSIFGIEMLPLIDAIRMFAISKMFLGDKEGTRKAILILLKKNPSYAEQANFSDPAEFTKLVSQFKVVPKGGIGIYVDVNRSRTVPFNNYQTSNSDTRYLPRLGNAFGAEYTHNYGLHWQAGINTSMLWVNYLKLMPTVNGWREQNIERLRLNAYGISGQYGIWMGKARPFLGIAMQAAHLVSSLSELSYKLLTDTTVQVVNDIDTRSFRYAWQYWIFPTAGVSFPAGNNATLSIGAYYAFGLRNVVNPTNRYSNNTLIFNHYYLDDDFRFQLPGIRLSFIQTISNRVLMLK